MSLSASVLGSLIDSTLSGQGANGPNRTKFSMALAKGIVQSIVGKSFTTADVGSIAGAGTGTGTGITGLNSQSMQQTALSEMGTTGVNAASMMAAIMDSTVQHLQQASLTSVDSPVYLGTGTIVVGSIGVNASEMSQNIDGELSSSGANGYNRTDFSKAIAAGIASGILSGGTGTLVIVGTPISGPSPGTGAGTGEIS